MRVAILGNLGNAGYTWAKFLRAKNVEADLFLPISESRPDVEYSPFIYQDPNWEDPGTGVDWIREYDLKRLKRNPFYLAKFIKGLRKYDLIHANTLFPILAQFVGKPYVAMATGADLKELVYEKTLKGYMMLRAYRKAPLMYFLDLDQVPAIRDHKLSHAKFCAQPVDTNRYASRAVDVGLPKGKNNLFHCSYLDWVDSHGRVTAKKNDLFFRAFAEYAKHYGEQTRLTVVEMGSDIEATRKLIKDLQIADLVKFVPKMNKTDLIRHYCASDMVVDQFGMPKFGLISVEAMSCAKALMVNFEYEWGALYYPEEPPIIKASTEEEIYEQLMKWTSKDELRALGLRARDWIVKYHHWEKATERLIFGYSTI